MRGYLETLLIKNDELSAQEKKQYLETALNYSQHLAKLVEELFELARLDSCESVVYSEAFSMGELVQDVTQSYLLRAQQKSIQLDAILSPDAPLIYGDIAMLQRVLENLLENGLRHTPEGGRISVSVNVDSGNVVVQITDTGCGIPEEDLPRIFERFYQVEEHMTRRHGGMGLGLTVAKSLIELHKGQIKVESVQGKGTRFELLLPLTQPK